MAINLKDKTLRDNNRTDLNFYRNEVKNVLPEHFAAEYPKLLTLLETYYKWMDSDQNPTDRISQLYTSRDATQIPQENLQYLEDELLLGQAYFGGFLNKREAVKFSNLLYRSKGTKYSIQQFFRAFFGQDVEIIYPKEQIFTVGPKIDYDLDSSNRAGQQIDKEASIIGPESRKFITDDKLYQTLSILIRSSLPISEWKDVYKIFVHPAGVFLGSEIVIVSQNADGVPTIQEEAGDPIPELLKQTTIGVFAIEPITDVTLINDSDRQIETQIINQYQNAPIEELHTGYADIGEFLDPNSKTFDESDGGGTIRDFATFSDSDLDSAGIHPDSFLKKQSFDLHKYDTTFDSA